MEFCQKTSVSVLLAFGSVERVVLIIMSSEELVTVSHTMTL